MMKKAGILVTLAVGMTCMFLVSCTTRINNPTGPSGTTGTAKITLYNYSSSTIYYLHTRLSGYATWSPDSLGSNTTIPVNGSYSLKMPAPQTYDFMANHSSHADSAFFSYQYMADGNSYSWYVYDADFTAASAARVILINGSANSISYFYYRTSATSSWTSASISSIPAGGRDTITVPTGVLDFKAANYYGDTALNTGIILSSGQVHTWQPTDANFGYSSNGSVRIVNNSSYSIFSFFYRQNGTTAWSSDMLPGTIAAGSADTVAIPAGTMDLKAYRSSTGDTCVIRGVTIPASGIYSWILTETSFTAAGPASLTIINSSRSKIYYIHTRLSGTSAWSTDYLGISTLQVDSSFVLSLAAPDTYDIMVNTSIHVDSATSLNQALLAGSGYTWTVYDGSFYGSSGTTHTITIVNNTTDAVRYLYKRPSGTLSWSSDFLAPNTIAGGRSYTVTCTPQLLDIQLQSVLGYTKEYLSQSVVNSNITLTITAW